MGALSLSAWLAPALMMSASAPAADPWHTQIQAASLRFGVPEPWIRAVIRLESGGRTERHGRPIRSVKGAMGLMQLMPGTWRDMRSRHGLGTDPDHPGDNILAGTAYLRLLYEQFGYPGMFAAYNAGPGRYAAWRNRGVALPAETRAYLSATLSLLGADIEPVAPSIGMTASWRTLFVPLAGQPRDASEPQ